MTGLAALLLLTLSPALGQEVRCKEPERPATGSTLTMLLKLDLTVVDSEAAAVEFASVSFLDAAPPVPERGAGRPVGLTRADGRLTAEVTYEWPDYFSDTRRLDSGAFDI